MKVAYEHIHDSKALPELVDCIIQSNKTTGELFVDVTYNNNVIFRCMENNGNNVIY